MQASRCAPLAAILLLACTVAVDGRSAGRLPAFNKPATSDSLGEGVRPTDEKDLPSFVTGETKQEDLATYLFSMTGCDYKKLEKNATLEDKVKQAITKTVASKLAVPEDDVSVVLEGGEAPQEAKAKTEEMEKEENKTMPKQEDVQQATEEEGQETEESGTEENEENGEESGEESGEGSGEESGGEESESEDADSEGGDSDSDSSEDTSADEADTSSKDMATADASADQTGSLLEMSASVTSPSMFAVVSVGIAAGGAAQSEEGLDGLGDAVAKAINDLPGIDHATGGATVVVQNPDVVKEGDPGEAGKQGPPGSPGPPGAKGESGGEAEIEDDEQKSSMAAPWMLWGGIAVHVVTLLMVYCKVKGELKAGREEIAGGGQGGTAA